MDDNALTQRDETNAVPNEATALDAFTAAAFLRYEPDTVLVTGKSVVDPDGKTHPRPFAAVEVQNAADLLPELMRMLTANGVGYWMLNGLDRSMMHRQGGDRAIYCPVRQGDANAFVALQGKPLPEWQPDKSFGYFHASDDHVRQLGFLWMDFDVGRPDEKSDEKQWADMRAGALIGEIHTHSADIAAYTDGDPSGFKRFPWPTFITRSGRGVTALWFLVDESGTGAPHATAENMNRWYAAELNLLGRTRQWGADDQCLHPARYLKMQGSKVTKVDPRETPEGRLVIDYTICAPGGSIPAYTLSDITRFYGLKTEYFKPWNSRNKITAGMFAEALSGGGVGLDALGGIKYFPVPDRPDKPKGLKRGKNRLTRGKPEARWEALASELLRLAEYRRFIRKGGRRKWFVRFLYQALYTANIQRWAREAGEEVSDGDLHAFANDEAFLAVQDFNERYCRPRLSREELHGAVDGAAAFQWKNERMAEYIAPTREEVEVCNLRSLQPPEMLAAAARAKREKKEQRKWRQARAREMLLEGRAIPEIMAETEYSRPNVYKIRDALLAPGGMPQVPPAGVVASGVSTF